MTKSWIVCDLDGTLCDERHRAQHAEAKDWETYHSLCKDDKPWEDTLAIVSRLTADDSIGLMIITGRTEPYREMTRKWFDQTGVFPDVLLMRPKDNYEKAGVLKVSQLEGFFGSKEKAIASVIVVLEDSDKVTQAWRDYGLPCWQVRSRA